MVRLLRLRGCDVYYNTPSGTGSCKLKTTKDTKEDEKHEKKRRGNGEGGKVINRDKGKGNFMFFTHRSDDWDRYVMDYANPHRELETPAQEMAVVDAALQALCRAGILPQLTI